MNRMLLRGAVCLIGATALLQPSLQAQQKELTAAQLLKNDRAGLMEELPRLRGWKDDAHYLLDKAGKGTLVVDARTGSEQPYADTLPPAKVYLRGNTLYYQTASGSEQQLTQDTLEKQNPTLSPDGQQVAFTRQNNLFVITLSSGKETRLTSDGSGLVYNGWASWVYYEEILGRASHYRAFWWSPDSLQIAYLHFNDARVPLYPLYGAAGQHGNVENTRYPQAGDPNPEVKIGIADIQTAATVWADFQEQEDQYFGTPFWTPDGTALWVQWMNRGQDHLLVYAIDPATGSKKQVYEERQKTWVSWLEGIHFLQHSKGYLVQSDQSGWMHIYQYNMEGQLVRQLTRGNWTVKDIVQVNEAKGLVYFTARKENTARFDLYAVDFAGKEPRRLTAGEYNNVVSVSPGGSYCISTCSNLYTPPKMLLMNGQGKKIRVIADSKGATLEQYRLAPTRYTHVTTPDGFNLPVLNHTACGDGQHQAVPGADQYLWRPQCWYRIR